MNDLRTAAIEEFEVYLEMFKNSILFKNPGSRNAILRLLDCFNRIGDEPREVSKVWGWDQRTSFEGRPDKSIPVFQKDLECKDDLRTLIYDARNTTINAIEKDVEAGSWSAVNAQKYINEFRNEFNTIRMNDPNLEQTAIDFLKKAFTLAARVTPEGEIIRNLARYETEKKEREEREKWESLKPERERAALESRKQEVLLLRDKIPDFFNNISARLKESGQLTIEMANSLVAKQDDIQRKLNTLISQEQWNQAHSIAKEFYEKWSKTKYWSEVFPSLKIATIIQLIKLADSLDRKGFHKEANQIDDITKNF